MNDDEFTRQLRRSLQQHAEPPLDDLAGAAIRRAGVRRRNRQVAAGALAVALVGGTALGSLQLGHHGDTAASQTTGLSAAPSTPKPAPAVASAPACTEMNAAWSVARGQKANGIVTYLVRVRPMGIKACTIGGVPGFWLVDPQETVVGAPAEHAGETGAPVVATEARPAVAGVRYDSTLARGASCRPTVGKVRLFAPGGTVPMGSNTSITGCRNADVKLFTVTSFVSS